MTIAMNVPATLDQSRRAHAAAVRAGVRVEQITIAWMVVEAVVAVGAGVLAHSVLLIAFGLDSAIELVTGSVLLGRLLTEMRGGHLTQVERAENRAAWITGTALAVLCLYILAGATVGLFARAEPDNSLAGIAVAVVALLGMPILAQRKRAIADQINSAALRGDAACSLTCAYMAATLLAGLGLRALFGWWWAEDAAALLFLYWLGREALSTLRAARAGRGGCCCSKESCAE